MKLTATPKYLALDVHQATSSFSVRSSSGARLDRGVVQTRAHDLVELLERFGPNVHVAFEEGTQAQWLHDLLLPHCDRLVVCDPRANRSGLSNKDDRIDADMLSELLRRDALRPVFHGSPPTRPLKELVRAYVALVRDAVRVMLRIKAIYRSRGIPTPGEGVYRPALRRDWLAKIPEPAARRRAQLFFAQLDALCSLRRQAKAAMLAETRKHPAFHLIQTFPRVGPIRAAEIIAIVGSPFRFRAKRNLWPYAGLAVVHQSSADHELLDGRIRRRDRRPMPRGLNRNFNRRLKKIFKDIAVDLSSSDTPLGEVHRQRLAGGMRKEMALLTLARTAAAIILAVWKKGVPYDPSRLKSYLT
jgi:transposase